MPFVKPSRGCKLVCKEVPQDCIEVVGGDKEWIELYLKADVGKSITVSLQDLKDLVTYLQGLE